MFYDLGIIKAEGNITSGDAHVAVACADLLRLGLVDYERRTKECLEALDLTDFKKPRSRPSPPPRNGPRS